MATVLIRSAHGATPDLTDVTGTNEVYSSDDTFAASGSANPLLRPASGSYYSGWRSNRLDVTVTPATSITNLMWYTDGTNTSPAGVTWLGQAANVGADAGYRIATFTTYGAGVSGDELEDVTNHTGLTGAPVDPFTFTAGSPCSLAGTLNNPSTGVFGDYFITQIVVASTTALGGAITAEPMYWVWDES